MFNFISALKTGKAIPFLFFSSLLTLGLTGLMSGPQTIVAESYEVGEALYNSPKTDLHNQAPLFLVSAQGCSVGDALCNCAGITEKKFAEPATACTTYYWCTQGEAYYLQCPAGTSFDNNVQACDWIQNVKCGSDG